MHFMQKCVVENRIALQIPRYKRRIIFPALFDYFIYTTYCAVCRSLENKFMCTSRKVWFIQDQYAYVYPNQ